MKEKDARSILQALVQGNHPKTGEPIADHPLLRDADVLRALLVGLDALAFTAARKERQALRPAKAGQPWTDEEDAALSAQFKRGESREKLAEAHNRSLAGIELRLQKLGLITAAEQAVPRSARSRQP